MVAEGTEIQYAWGTWNPWQGCTKKRPLLGCQNCYMWREKRWHGQDPARVVRSADSTFRAPLRWARQWKPGSGEWRALSCSWSDFFHPAADEWREEAWAIMRTTAITAPGLFYLVLTKWPERIQGCLPADWGDGYANVVLMVTIESPEVVPDMDILRGVPALLRGVSCEPLLGDLGHLDLSGFGWLVDGGESGPVARPADHEWFHSLRRQALDAGIPYFHKQNGGNRKVNGAWGGRELEGSTWGGVPELLPLALEHQARALEK